jgi:ribosomal protein L37AE/L43A
MSEKLKWKEDNLPDYCWNVSEKLLGSYLLKRVNGLRDDKVGFIIKDDARSVTLRKPLQLERSEIVTVEEIESLLSRICVGIQLFLNIDQNGRKEHFSVILTKIERDNDEVFFVMNKNSWKVNIKNIIEAYGIKQVKTGVKIDSEMTQKATCPHCGYEEQKCFDWVDDNGEHDCENCGKTYSYERTVIINYSTFKIK